MGAFLGWRGSGAETSEWASWRSCWLLFDGLAGQLRKPRAVIHTLAGQAGSNLPQPGSFWRGLRRETGSLGHGECCPLPLGSVSQWSCRWESLAQPLAGPL